MKRVQESERFQAVSDDGGYETTIVVSQTYVDVSSRSGSSEIPAGKEARTIDGLACNIRDDGTIEIVNPFGPSRIVRRK